ncbi:MAG TPA: helix-turn-helix transcriptional regulator [Alphaproteobacteria bacterium]|jgi:transcriptional regulator with XRE-family HTH domain|nr:helix-turn-helix transcriptional regulator [Alphaproteobacteria bacterium]
MDIRKKLAENLRRIRLERGLSQEALALEADIDRAYMSGLERGVRNPTVMLLAKLANALKVPLGDLIAVEGLAEPPPQNLPRGRAGKGRTATPKPKSRKSK